MKTQRRDADARRDEAGGADDFGRREPSSTEYTPTSTSARYPDRLPVPQRVGTVIDHRFAEPITAHNARPGESLIGLLDTSQRVAQVGGEESGFIFFKDDLLTLPAGAWAQIRDAADVIEWVCNVRNKVYRVDIEDAVRHGRFYDAGLGKRWGVPRIYATVERGEVKPARVTAAREEPAVETKGDASPQLSFDFKDGAA